MVKNGCGLGFETGSESTRRRRGLILAVVGLPGWSLPNAGSVSQMRLGPRSERNSCSRSFGIRHGVGRGEIGESITIAFTRFLSTITSGGCIIFHSCHSLFLGFSGESGAFPDLRFPNRQPSVSQVEAGEFLHNYLRA